MAVDVKRQSGKFPCGPVARGAIVAGDTFVARLAVRLISALLVVLAALTNHPLSSSLALAQSEAREVEAQRNQPREENVQPTREAVPPEGESVEPRQEVIELGEEATEPGEESAAPKEEAVAAATAARLRKRRYDATADGDFHKGARREAPDPFRALGLRAGAFVISPELQASLEFTDNVFAANDDRQSDVARVLRGRVDVRSDWRRHALELRLMGARRYFESHPSENEASFEGQLRGRLDIRRRTTLSGALGYSLSQEARSSVNATPGAETRPDIRTRSASLTLAHRFNRLALQLRGSLTETIQDDALSEDGSIDKGDDESYLEKGLSLRGGYLSSPGNEIFVLAEWRRQSFAAPSDNDGLSRNSLSRALSLGITKRMGGKLRGEARIGYARIEPEESALPAVAGLIVDAGLIWEPSALTRLEVTAKSRLSPTTLSGSLGALERTFALDVRHALRRYLIATAGLGYTIQDYEGSGLEERQWALRAGVEYLFNRNLAFLAGYDYSELMSTEPGRGYHENRLRFTLRARR